MSPEGSPVEKQQVHSWLSQNKMSKSRILVQKICKTETENKIKGQTFYEKQRRV
jgi:hypothetical protein